MHQIVLEYVYLVNRTKVSHRITNLIKEQSPKKIHLIGLKLNTKNRAWMSNILLISKHFNFKM